MIVLLAALVSLQLRSPHEDRARPARRARRTISCWPTTSPDIIILIDARGLLRYVSRSAEPVLGLRPKDLRRQIML